MSEPPTVGVRDLMARVVMWHYATRMQLERIRANWHGALHSRQIDLELFIVALIRFRRAVAALGDFPGVTDTQRERIRVAADAFGAALPDAGDVRDWQEHFDEYLVGKGRHQAKAEVTAPPRVIFTGTGQDFIVTLDIPGIGSRSLSLLSAVQAADALEAAAGQALDGP